MTGRTEGLKSQGGRGRHRAQRSTSNRRRNDHWISLHSPEQRDHPVSPDFAKSARAAAGTMAHMSVQTSMACDRPALISPTQKVFRPFTVRSRPAAGRAACQASQNGSGASADRRQVLQMAGLLAASQLAGPARAAKVGGFVPFNDQGDAYKLVYPFGWQEVSVGGQDVVFKDIIEPLESVSVSLTPTDKDDITLFGAPEDVAYSLADKVLTPASQPVKILKVTPKRVEDRNYVEIEFAAKSNTYIRLAIAVVTIANGKLYTMVTGANQDRWDKVKDKLELVARSFIVSTKY